MEQNCPVCKAIMINNIEGKQRNSKAPDWKCSNPECKFQWDKATKTYIPSQYRTGIWDNKIASPYPNAPKPEYPYYNAPRPVSGSTPTPNAVPGAKQSDKTCDLTEVVSLLKEIRDSLKTKFPEPDDSEFGA